MGTTPRKAAVLTRKELYQRVWETPLARLCKEFGISDSGLAKICRRHGIPLPGVGYWAKRNVGKAPRTPPLPPGDDAAIRVQPFVCSPRPEGSTPASDSEQHPELDEDVQQLLGKGQKIEEKINATLEKWIIGVGEARVRKRERLAEERARQERLRAREDHIARQEQERARVGELLEQVGAWEQSRALRAYVRRVQIEGHPSLSANEVAEWSRWATEQADSSTHW